MSINTNLCGPFLSSSQCGDEARTKGDTPHLVHGLDKYGIRSLEPGVERVVKDFVGRTSQETESYDRLREAVVAADVADGKRGSLSVKDMNVVFASAFGNSYYPYQFHPGLGGRFKERWAWNVRRLGGGLAWPGTLTLEEIVMNRLRQESAKVSAMSGQD